MGMSIHDRRAFVLSAMAVAGLAAATTLLAYRTSPLLPLAVVFGLAVVVLVFTKPVLGIALGLLAVPLDKVSLSVGGAFALTPAKALLLLAGAACALRIALERTTIPVHRAHFAFAGLLVVAAAGLAVAHGTFVTLKTVVDWTAFLCISIQASRLDSKTALLLLTVLVLSAGALGIIEIATTGNQTLVNGGAEVVNRGTAAFSNANLLSFYLVLALGPAIVLATRSFGWMSVAFAVAAGLVAAGIVLSLTRSALIGMAVALFVLLWWPPFRRIGALVLGVVLVAVIANPRVLTQSKELNIVTTRLGTIQHFSSTSGDRLRVWATAEHIIVDHPFVGIGEGNFSAVSSTSYGLLDTSIRPPSSFEHAHDVPLTIAAETGLIGLALFLWFVVETGRAGLAALSRWKGRPEFGLAIALIASLTGEAVLSTVDYPINNDVVMAATMLEVGLVIALSRWDTATGQ
jgi:O-antigen ligase